jgi:hypothetical protein
MSTVCISHVIYRFYFCYIEGKFVVSYVPICGEKEYYLACACGEWYVPPSAYVSLLGLTVQQSFLRGNIFLLLFVYFF